MNFIISSRPQHVIVSLLILVFQCGCSKNKISKPTLAALSLTSLTATSVNYSDWIKSDGGAPLTHKGVCWSSSPAPVEDMLSAQLDTGMTGAITGKIENLSGGFTYYIRAFAANSAGTSYSNEIKITTLLAPGQPYQGGIVVWVDTSGRSGLIASVDNLSTYAQWYSGTDTPPTTGAVSDSDGRANTDKIIAVQQNGVYAAKICKDYRGGGYSDWFLPSIGQLQLMYEQKKYLNNVDDYIYWSSTEYYGLFAEQLLLLGNHVYFTYKGSNAAVRAVRTF